MELAKQRSNGEFGVTVKVYKQNGGHSKSLTISGAEVDQVFEYIKFFFRAKQESEKGKMIIEMGDENG